MNKILTIVGARPQFIKAATVSRAIRQHNLQKNGRSIHEVIVHTGQHFDSNMSDIFFKQLEIPTPDYNLGIANLSHAAMTGRMLEGIEIIIKKEKPDWVLVYGDTNSTLAGSLSAAKLHVPVAHVEAGLRSHNIAMPEEINRTLSDRISTLLFCPTETAVDNLKNEGYPFLLTQDQRQQIINVGDVMYDATLFYKQKAKESVDLAQWGLEDKQYVLCTLHRAENTDNPKRLESIFSALKTINKDLSVVLPLHPRTRNLLKSQGHEDWLRDLNVLGPVPYLEMQRLEMSAKVILTDSGGVQKEAFFHNVSCITLRDETEWTETVDSGWNHVAGSETHSIINAYLQCSKPVSNESKPYGDGHSAKKIIELLL